MLILFCLCNVTIGVGWICFAPLFDLLEELYGVNLMTINYLSLSFCIIFLPMNFPSTYVLDTYGLRVGLTIGMIVFTLGLWVRCLINYSFWYVVIGQTILAIC